MKERYKQAVHHFMMAGCMLVLMATLVSAITSPPPSILEMTALAAIVFYIAWLFYLRGRVTSRERLTLGLVLIFGFFAFSLHQAGAIWW